ncbi:iron-sulfur cluster carrier protein ApbC [bacterium]|nr:iron-sulfur cluster carrier protein ApbC [bacterium]
MSKISQVSPEQVLQALRRVNDPDLRQDLVSLGMIRDLEVSGSTVSFRVVLTTPACPMKKQIEEECRTQVTAIPGVGEVKIRMDAEVRRPRMGQSPSSQPIEGVGHIIAVSSGKGGVGKSTVAVNLAVSLALEGARVGIMDADIYGPNLPTMLGVTEDPQIEKNPEKGEIFIPPSAHGLKVMSMGFLVKGDQPMAWRGPMLHSVVQQFCHKVNWGHLDYLVVDMPPGTGDVQLSLSQVVPVSGAVVVTTPQEVSMQDVRKALAMFDKVRIPLLGIVENMSYFEVPGTGERHYLFGQDGGKALAAKYRTELLAQIPLVQRVREGGDLGRPIVIADPSSSVAQQFRSLARSVAQQISIQQSQAGQSEPIQIGKFS